MLNFIGQQLHMLMKYLDRYRLINDRKDQKPYLERYYLFLKDRKNFPFNIFVHKFLSSDPDDLHDHPWGFISIPLYPGYYEHTINGRYWRGPFNVRLAKATSLHRIEIGPENYCWTLFIPFKRIREWGFQTKNGWIHNEKYLTDKKHS